MIENDLKYIIKKLEVLLKKDDRFIIDKSYKQDIKKIYKSNKNNNIDITQFVNSLKNNTSTNTSNFQYLSELNTNYCDVYLKDIILINKKLENIKQELKNIVS